MRIVIAQRVAVDVVDPPPSYARYFDEAFGHFSREPAGTTARQIVVRFAGRVAADDCRFASRNVSVRDGLAFFHDRSGGVVQVPVGALAEPRVEVVASRDSSPDSFYGYVLLGLIQTALLAERMTLVHSSSIQIGNRATLLPAWSGAGKTKVLIEAIRHGADALSDDFAILSADGVVHAFPRPLNVFDHNCRWYPHLMRHFLRSKWHWYAASRTVRAATDLSMAVLDHRSLVVAAMRRLAELSKGSLSLRLAPHLVRPGAVFAEQAPLDRVVWLVRSSSGAIRLEDASPEDTARAIAHTLGAELEPFLSIVRGWQSVSGGEAGRAGWAESWQAAVAAVVLEGFRTATIRRVSIPVDVTPGELFSALRLELGFEEVSADVESPSGALPSPDAPLSR